MKLPKGIGMLAGLCRDLLPTAEHEQHHAFIGVRGLGGYLRLYWEGEVCRFAIRVDDPATGRGCFEYMPSDGATDVLGEDDRNVLAFLLVVVHGDRSEAAMDAPNHEAWLRAHAKVAC